MTMILLYFQEMVLESKYQNIFKLSYMHVIDPSCILINGMLRTSLHVYR